MSSATPTVMRLSVRVQPRASRNRITGWQGAALGVALTAPPVDGAANSALVDFLAEALEVKRSAVRIVAGQRSRNKVVEVAVADLRRVQERISALADDRGLRRDTPP